MESTSNAPRTASAVSTPHRTGGQTSLNGHFRSDASTPPPQSRASISLEVLSSEVFTAAYSGVPVLEMTCRGVSVMRRRSDSALNATQILKVAGIGKGNRTKILEREILTGPHEKVQGGYGKYQGTWVSYDIGVKLCETYGVREILRPLLELDTTSAPAMHATPTKEQHQASVRRQQLQAGNGSGRNSAIHPRPAAVYDPQRMQPRGASAVLLASLQPNKSPQRQSGDEISTEPRDETDQGSRNSEQSSTRPPVPWNGSHAFSDIDHKPLAFEPLPPLTSVTAKDFDRSREVMTNIFLESDHGRVPDILMNSEGTDLDLDVPIDELGHSALHWASALARLSLVQTLVSRGANPNRGNTAGETALMRAVMATNTMDQNCFLELLNALGPSIAIRDSAKRTVLHHIAMTAGIKGRSAASRYYLTSLLEWIVKNDQHVTIDFSTFGNVLVDAQDRNGDTALNIAARIGNRGIAQSLLEVNADLFLPNKAGIRPVDSGTVDERVYGTTDKAREPPPQPQRNTWSNPTMVKASGQVAVEVGSLLTSLQKDFEQEMATKCKAVDEANAKLREASKALAELRRQVEHSKTQVAKLDDIAQRIRNTNNAIQTETREYNESQTGQAPPQFGEEAAVGADADGPFVVHQGQPPPSAHILRARIRAYHQDLSSLDILAVRLNDQSLAMEARCRRLVSLCTNSPLDQVDETLPALLAALQSDGDPREFDLNEANRVAGFLKILS